MTNESRGLRGNQGFSLLEVLVAFSILTISLGVLLGVFSTGSRNTALARDYSRAIALAESKLAEIGVVEPLEVGEQQGGFDDDFRWQIEVTEYVMETVGDEPLTEPLVPILPYQVRVRVWWRGMGRERSVALSTLRLAGEG